MPRPPAICRRGERCASGCFVFLSSIRAQTGAVADGPVTEERPAAPTDAYGRSKLEAEQALAELDIDWVALRPVLVYGHGVKGYLAALAKPARSSLCRLPLGGLRARRSLLSADNLVDAVDAVLASAVPLRRPFIVADTDALTVPEMIAAMRKGLGRNAGLIPVPASLLRLALNVAGHPAWYERLAQPLVADPSALVELGWRPRVSTAHGLETFMSTAG